MATTTSPPSKPQNTKGFVIAASVMLLLTVGLLYFKLGGNKAPPPKPAPVASVKPPAPKRLEHAPPPPPPVLPEASAPEKAPQQKVQRTARAPSGGCSGTCEGKVTTVLQSALHAKGFQGRGCYERALRQNPMLEGRLSIRVRVGAQGQVCSASIAADSVGDPGVTACVLQLFRSARLPPPSMGCVDVQVPLNFVTKT
jgi:TonB family protein